MSGEVAGNHVLYFIISSVGKSVTVENSGLLNIFYLPLHVPLPSTNYFFFNRLLLLASEHILELAKVASYYMNVVF